MMRALLRPARLVLASIVFCLAGADFGRAQEGFTFRPARSYSGAVPTPEALLGHSLGERFSRHEALLRAVDAIAASSDRVRVRRYGTSYGGRPLVLCYVSSPARLARLSSVAEASRSLSDPRSLEPPALERLLAEHPVVTWLSFNVHGNEPSPSEAAIALLYHLCAAEDRQVEQWLERSVIVIDPCLNPDGRERYVSWLDGVMGLEPDPDPRAQEHDEPWPGGRFNHYFFDLNRDWAFLTQRETQARIAAYRELPPQVHVDFHEMSPESSYFFFPAAGPVNANVPRGVLHWGGVFGRRNGAAFDRFGWRYYTGEEFDLFYPGYGDAWPSLNGAIGMTYEQAGHGVAGTVIRRPDGSLLTLHDRVAHHFTAALTTVATAAEHRRELLSDYHRSFEDALWEGRNGPERAFVLAREPDPAACDELVSLLLRQGIEVSRASTPIEARRAHDYSPGAPAADERFPAGTYVVSLAQPLGRLAKALLEPRTPARQPYFYDVSAWSLPLLFGVDAWWCEAEPTGGLEALTELVPPQGRVEGGVARVAYLVPWDAARAPRLLDRLLREEVRVFSAREPFVLGGETFPPGTLVLPVAENGERLHEIVARLAAAASARVVAAGTSLTERGPDLGSDAILPLGRARVAIATGPGVQPSSAGAVRFLFEQRLGTPVTMLPLENLGSTDLGGFDVLVLPDGYGYRRTLHRSGVEAAQRFAADGGVVVALAGGAFALLQDNGGFLDVKATKEPDAEPAQKPKEGEPGGPPPKKDWIPLREERERRRETAVPGTLFRVKLDPDHRLAFGDRDEHVTVLMEEAKAFQLEGPGTRLGIFDKDSLVAGFASKENVERLVGQAYLAEVPVGRGHVLLFANDPNFRGFSRGQTGLFLNAVYLFRAPRR